MMDAAPRERTPNGAGIDPDSALRRPATAQAVTLFLPCNRASSSSGI